MAGNLSDYAEEKILLSSVGKTASSWPPTDVWIALYSVTPGDATAGTEITGTGYARVKVTSSTTTTGSVFGSYLTGQIKNNNTQNATSAGLGTAGAGTGTITFPQATASWGTVNGVALVTASTAGSVIWYGDLSSPKTVNSGDTVSFAAGDLVLSLD